MESDAAQAFLFLSLVDNVSYFVQLQSWSLKEGNPPPKKKKKIADKKLWWNEQNSSNKSGRLSNVTNASVIFPSFSKGNATRAVLGAALFQFYLLHDRWTTSKNVSAGWTV